MSATLSLIRQDPARGALVRALASCLGAGLFLRVVPDITAAVADLTVDDLPGGFIPMYSLFTALVATFVLGANAWTRSSRLALGLPVSTRRVWAVRTGSLMTVGLLSVAALAAGLGLSFDAENRRLMMNGVIALAAARGAVAVLVLLFAYQLPHSRRDRIPIGPAYIIYLVGATVLIVVFSSVRLTSVVGTLFLLVVAIVLGAYLWLRIPRTFSIGPTVEESEAPVALIREEANPAPSEALDEPLVGDLWNSRLALHWTIFRGLKTNILPWFLIAIVGVSAAVVTLEFFKGTNAFLPLFFLVIYQLPLLQSALEGMTPFDPLPISRRALWAHSVGPIIVAATVGACVALMVLAIRPQVFTQLASTGCCVKAPWDYMELSGDGRVPTITSAWGERYTPTAHRLWKGRAAALYDPFEVGPQSSPRFAEYQMRRAVAAVYGLPVPEALLKADHEPPPNIVGGAERGAFALAETRGRLSADRNRTATVALALLAVVCTAPMLSVLLQFGPSVHRTLFKRASIGFIAVLVVIAVAVSIARLLAFTEVWYIGALISIGLRALAHWLPVPTWFLWTLCVTFWAGAYLILERVFSTIEFPREKTMNRFAEEY